MATVVLALLFVLMVVASSLLLKQIKSSITPRRLRSFKIPSIFKHDPESKLERTRKSGRCNALRDNKITCDQVTHSDGQSKEMVHGSTLPDVVAGVEKVTTSLSNYVGIDNIAFDKAERISIRNKLLNIDTNPDMNTFPNNGAATKEQHDRKDSNASRNRYTDAYKSVAGIETEMSLSVTSIQNSEQRPNTDGNVTTAGQKPEYLNHGFDDTDIQNTVTEEMKEKEPTANMVPEAPATNGQIDGTTVDNQRLSVDVETAYRGSIDKVRRLTGTEPVGPEIKEILNERSEKRKKFLRACTTVAAFMTAYLGCGLPYYILSLIELSQGTATEDSVERRTVRMICAIFLYLLPIIDPILYTSRFVIVRQTLGRVVPRCCRCRKQNDT
ncbi:MAG: G-protein coupled receptor [Candidatus Thiodiazotropha sp. LLP2]